MKPKQTTPAQPVDLPRLVRPLRTDDEIVSQTNRLAFTMALLSGYAFDADYKFHRHSRLSDNPMPRQALFWEMARQSQILLTDTDPDDALDNLDWPNDTAQLRAASDEPSTESATGALAAAPCSAYDLLKPFLSAPIPSDKSSMSDVVKAKLAEAAETLGYREGKEAITMPPEEWCERDDEVLIAMRAAWVRGCERGMRVRQNDSSSATAEARRGACPTVARTEDAPNVAAAPLAESTRRDAPEPLAAAPLLAVIAFRLEFRGERRGMQWRLVA